MRLEAQEVSGFEGLSERWNELLAHSRVDAPFLTYQFQSLWWDAFGGGKELRLLALRDGRGELRGIAPFYQEGPMVRLVGGTELADYLDLIASPGLEREAWEASIECLQGRDDWRRVELHSIREGSPTREALPGAAEAMGLSLEETREDVCPVVELPSTWDDYLDGLSRKHRHELRRKLRRADEAGGVDCRVARGGEELDRGLEDFFELHRESGEGKEAFMDAPMEAFFRRMTGAMAAEGWVELATGWMDGRPVASYLCFLYGEEILVYNSGYSPGPYGPFSPGIVLLAHYIRDAIGRGLRRFDFLRGDERYKYELGGRDTSVYRITLTRT